MTGISEISIGKELDILVEEWKHIEGIISRHVNIAFKIRAWFLGLLTALIVGLFSDKIEMSTPYFYALSFLIMLTFLLMELQQRTFLVQAMTRSSQIERMIRGEIDFDSPRISDSFQMKHNFKTYLKIAKSSFILIPYICVAILIILTGLTFAKI